MARRLSRAQLQRRFPAPPDGKVWVTPEPGSTFLVSARELHDDCAWRIRHFDNLPPQRRERERIDG